MQLGQDGLLLATVMPKALPGADLSSQAKGFWFEPGEIRTGTERSSKKKCGVGRKNKEHPTALERQETFFLIFLAKTGKAL